MYQEANRYFILNKPYNMVSQFISPHKVGLLSDIDFEFPDNTHAVGRLDNNSEGLLILTTDKKVTRLLFHGVPHTRVYLVQVKNVISEESLKMLQNGISIRIKGGQGYKTPPCEVSVIENPEAIYQYKNGLEQRSPNSWLQISLLEGKYHQVRKMVAAIGHRCIRLIRVSIENISLENLAPGAVKEIGEKEFYELLHIIIP